MNFGVVSMPPVFLHPRVGNMPLAKARIKINKHPKYCTKKHKNPLQSTPSQLLFPSLLHISVRGCNAQKSTELNKTS
jgi:hypothetical protein